MNVLQHTRNERNPCLKHNRPDRSYRDTLLNAGNGMCKAGIKINFKGGQDCNNTRRKKSDLSDQRFKKQKIRICRKKGKKAEVIYTIIIKVRARYDL